MRGLRKLLSGLAVVMAGLFGGQAHADPINLTIDLNGVPLISFSSVAPDQSVSFPLIAVNSALTAAGSAYQFTSLSAQSNYTGDGFASLETTFQLNTSGPGTTAAVLSIDTVQSGFLAPVGTNGMAVSAAGGSFVSANGSLTYTSDYQGANTPTLVFLVAGTDSYSDTTGALPIGAVPSGFQLSNHFLVSLDQTSESFLGGTGGVIVTAGVPEPASVGLMLSGVAIAGVALPRLRRKAKA